MSSQSFDLDNAGSSFEVDDNELDAILESVSGESEDDEMDTVSTQEFGLEPARQSPPPPSTESVQVAPPAPAVFASVEESPSSDESVNEPAAVRSERSEPVVARKKPSVKGAFTLDSLRRVLKVLEIYRELPKIHQEVVSKFVANGTVLEDEAKIVLAVLESDDALARTMKNLKRAKDFEPVDRSFFVMELNEIQLNDLGELVSVFSEIDYSRNYPRHKNGKNIVRAVEALTPEMMGYVDSTEKVLSVAHGEG